MYQITVDETDNHIGHLRLGCEQFAKPYLYILVIAEASRYGEHHGEDGHNCQQRGVSQCRRLCHHPLLAKETDGKV